MAFTVPNAADATTYPQQARLDSRDLDIINASEAGLGVFSGCAVTAQGTPNMTVAVSAGYVNILGVQVTVTAGASPTFAAANATNPRIDLLTVDSTGAKLILAGTAAATPVMPSIPAGRVVLARVDIPANATTITNAQIVDKRILLLGAIVTPESFGAVGDCRYVTNAAITTGTAVLTSASSPFLSSDVGKPVVVKGAGTAADTLNSTVLSYQSATQVTLATNAATTVTNAEAAVGTDDQTALQSALDSLVSGQTLLLGAGKNYLHSGVLSINVAGSGIDGNLSGALMGSQAATCAVKVNAANVRLQDLLIFLPGLSIRPSIPSSSGIWVNGMDAFYSNRVTVQSGTFGLLGATNFEVIDPVVRYTLADGIHMTAACRNGKIVRPTVIRPGDDGVAVVSYTADGATCSNIEIRSPRVWGQTNGRGVTVVGGTDITYTDVQVYGSDAAGVYIAQEFTSFVTYPILRVKVQGGRLSLCNRTSNGGDQGGVLIASQATGAVLSGIEIADLIIEDTRAGATENFRFDISSTGSTVTNMTVDRLQFRGAGPNYDWPQAGWPTGVTASNIDNLQKVFKPLVVTTDLTTTATTGAQPGSLGWGISSVGTYLVEMEGQYQSSATTLGPRFGINGNIAAVGTVTTMVEQNTSTTAITRTTTGWASNVGVNPATANTAFPIRFRALVTVNTLPTGSGATLGLNWQMSAAGTGTLKAGTSVQLTRLA